MPVKKTFILRLLLILIIIVSFIILCRIFISQYKQYREIENRLNIAYANNSKVSPGLYKLFSTFSEVDNLFRLYSISFDDKNFKAYQNKLDTLGQIIHALDTIPAASSSLKKDALLLDQSLSFQYIALKKQIDDLIVFADEKLAKAGNIERTTQKNRIVSADSVINRILNDTTSLVQADTDTIIRKKENLFKRIFNAKNDTVLNKNNNAVLNVNQIDIVQKNIENLIRINESRYNSNFRALRNAYLQSKDQERQLITSNYELINELKKSIEQIREIEYTKFRNAEKEDYLLYKLNTLKFRNYAIMALCVILLMLIFIIYYQYVVSNYEKKITKEKDYASRLAKEKTNLLANISHEIRTPLHSLKGVVKLLKNNRSEDIDDKMLTSIDYDINLINNTVNDILNLSKIESDAVEVTLEKVYISKIVDDTFSLHKYLAEQKGLKFINENHLDKMLRINSNEFRLRQIISNLISNALKYTKKGTIKVVSKVINDKIVIEVIDTGIGIEEKKLDQIFRKYYTVDGDNTKVGFGLGLHISQLLAKQIGGKLSVKSQLGVGSTFSLQISNNKKGNKTKQNEELTEIKELPNDVSIVFIDDNKINLLIAKQTFKEFKDIATFENAYEALSYIEMHKPQLVITDIIMPRLTGWDVLEAIKSNESLAHIKVIANTAEGSFAKNISADYQFDGILEKGFDLIQLSKIYYN